MAQVHRLFQNPTTNTDLNHEVLRTSTHPITVSVIEKWRRRKETLLQKTLYTVSFFFKSKKSIFLYKLGRSLVWSTAKLSIPTLGFFVLLRLPFLLEEVCTRQMWNLMEIFTQ